MTVGDKFKEVFGKDFYDYIDEFHHRSWDEDYYKFDDMLGKKYVNPTHIITDKEKEELKEELFKAFLIDDSVDKSDLTFSHFEDRGLMSKLSLTLNGSLDSLSISSNDYMCLKYPVLVFHKLRYLYVNDEVVEKFFKDHNIGEYKYD